MDLSTNIFGLKIAGISVIIGVVFFFINKAYEKQPFASSGLDIGAIGTNLKDRKVWFWVILPIIMDVVCITFAKLFLPEYIEHVLARGRLLQEKADPTYYFRIPCLACNNCQSKNRYRNQKFI